MAASVTSLVTYGIPWLAAQHIADGSPDADTLIAYGMSPLLATEIAAAPTAAEATTVPRLLHAGLPPLVAQEIYNILNP